MLESVRYLVPAGMTVLPGCEYYWDSDVYDAADWAPRPLGESRCVLIELPYHAELDNAKRGVELAIRHGQTPILAHPERYDIFQEQPGQTLAWVRESGVLLQLNAFDLTDTEHRQAVRDAAWRLVSARLATFLGTDTHGRKRMPVYAEGAELLRLWAEREADGAAYLEGLTHGNAERLLLGRTAE